MKSTLLILGTAARPHLNGAELVEKMENYKIDLYNALMIENAKIIKEQEARGYWNGEQGQEIEPSIITTVKAERDKIEKRITELKEKYEQEAIGIFQTDKNGGSLALSFSFDRSRAQEISEKISQFIGGFSLVAGRALWIGNDPQEALFFERVAEEHGARVKATAGQLTFI
jgi:hypothetical protein